MSQYDQFNQSNVPAVKKPFKIKIAGFNIGLGPIIAVGVLILIVVISSLVSGYIEKQEAEAAYQEYLRRLEESKNSAQVSQEPLSIHDQIQKSLVERYGVAPDGFEWGYDGSLISLGDDDDHTCEDIVYIFIRSLSVLDFATAERYSSGSAVASSYRDYYSGITNMITDYYQLFLRRQFKTSLTSVEIDSISDIAVFADGTQYVTVTVKCLDLTDKDFWRADRDNLFQQMRVYRETESDTVKMEQYIYEYISGKYEDGSIGKKSHTIELVVSKQSGGGWLVSGDRELNAYLMYENGVDVASYIFDDFANWYQNTLLQEQLAQIHGGSED